MIYIINKALIDKDGSITFGNCHQRRTLLASTEITTITKEYFPVAWVNCPILFPFVNSFKISEYSIESALDSSSSDSSVSTSFPFNKYEERIWSIRYL